jgi:hypothetical protein
VSRYFTAQDDWTFWSGADENRLLELDACTELMVAEAIVSIKREDDDEFFVQLC